MAAPLLPLLVLAMVLFGCVTHAVLDPGSEFVPPSPIQVPLVVGVYHSPELRAYTREVGTHLTTALVLPFGDATMRLLDPLYPSVFARVVPMDGRTPLSAAAPRVDAVIEPTIERFDVSTGPFVAGQAFAWAMITYRFTAWSPTGQSLASWTVTGTGEAAAGDGGIDQSVVAAVERAMRDAAHKWVTGFVFIPEARRWARGLPVADATASEARQVTTQAGPGVRAEYAEVVAADGEFTVTTPGVLSAKLRVTNIGRHRLFVRPDDVTLRLGDTVLHAAPASALAVRLTPTLGRVPPAPPFAGVGSTGIRAMAAANLVGALINLALMQAEQRRFEAALTSYREDELRDVTLWEKATTVFAVHFLLPRYAGLGGVVTLPVVDFDRAVRYVLQLPVSGAEGGSR